MKKLSTKISTGDTALTEAIEVAKELVEGWAEKTSDQFQAKELAGGITNQLFRVSHEGFHVLVRIYGSNTEFFLDREVELQTIEALSNIGLAPALYGTFENGFVYGYFEGQTLDATTMSTGRHSEGIAKKMAQWHSSDIVIGDKEIYVWKKLDDFLALIPERYDSEMKNEMLKKSGISRDKLLTEMSTLKSSLHEEKLELGLCHNDLLSGNILYDEAKDVVHFIDYEYGSYNYNAYDIANHFVEWSGFELNYDQFPNKEQQLLFIRKYLSALTKEEPSDEEINKLYRDINRMVLLTHFFWGVWALVQASISKISFDYIGYGIKRLQFYYENKDKLLSL